MKAPTIKATKDYGQFSFVKSNRPVKDRDIKSLTKAIEKKNFLHLFPIIVNKEREVIEGQHRLTVAKKLGLTIYYIEDNAITPADIAMVNSNRKSWTARDYVHYHATEGNKPFKNMQVLLDQYPKLSPTSIAKLMDGEILTYATSGGNVGRRVREGKINDDNHHLAVKILATAQALHDKKIDYAFNPYFLLDIKNAIVQSEALLDTACKKILEKQSSLPRFADSTPPRLLSNIKQILGVHGDRGRHREAQVKAFLNRNAA